MPSNVATWQLYINQTISLIIFYNLIITIFLAQNKSYSWSRPNFIRYLFLNIKIPLNWINTTIDIYEVKIY